MRITRHDIMGMPITVAIPHGPPAAAAVTAAVFARLSEIDAVYSTYKSDSVISRFNRAELTRGDLPAEVQRLLQDCDEYKHATDGYFNIWRHGDCEPLGYVKGWAIAEAAAIIRQAGISDFAIDAGGDMVLAGCNDDHQPWRVGIRHPIELDKTALPLALSDKAIATSGRYIRGDHIDNPHTGRPATELLSVSVIGADIISCDVWATALFAAGASYNSLLVKLPAGYGLCIIDAAGQMIASPAILAE